MFTILYCTQLQAIGPLNPVLWEHLKKYSRTKPAGPTKIVITRAILAAPATTVTSASLTSMQHAQSADARDAHRNDMMFFIFSGPF
jgi:hypothetical protein